MTRTLRYFIAASFLIGGAVIMCTLGIWQLQRLEWKDNVIAQLDQEYAKPTDALLIQLNALPDKDIIYASLKGRFDYTRQIFFGPKTHDEAIGYHAITPFKTAHGTILVNRGWAPESAKETPVSTPQRTEVITGIIRMPEWNSFTPNNNPEADVWTKLAPKEIAKANNVKNVSDRVLYMSTPETSAGGVISAYEKWYPRNKHRQYAAFWFSMMGIFLGFFAVFTHMSKKKA